MNTSSHSTGGIAPQTPSPKLLSLLALATGAVALPQTGLADIIYTDLSSNPAIVGFSGGGASEFIFDLPGTANVGFRRIQGTYKAQPNSATVNYRLVLAGDLGGGELGVIRGNAPGVAAPQPFGATWDQGAGSLDVPVAKANDLLIVTPTTGYANQYLAWGFNDSTQQDARYGWVEITLSVGGYNSGGPNVTILRYAYDDTGAKPTMGQAPVPEPSSAALLVFGAMALGARGLRNWRQIGPQTVKPERPLTHWPDELHHGLALIEASPFFILLLHG